eukprot:Hpha_TRINITY_DN22135_c0_g1::TRINITY_DN22135_c0_g1_i1::g.103707::m.103707
MQRADEVINQYVKTAIHSGGVTHLEGLKLATALKQGTDAWGESHVYVVFNLGPATAEETVLRAIFRLLPDLPRRFGLLRHGSEPDHETQMMALLELSPEGAVAVETCDVAFLSFPQANKLSECGRPSSRSFSARRLTGPSLAEARSRLAQCEPAWQEFAGEAKKAGRKCYGSASRPIWNSSLVWPPQRLPTWKVVAERGAKMRGGQSLNTPEVTLISPQQRVRLLEASTSGRLKVEHGAHQGWISLETQTDHVSIVKRVRPLASEAEAIAEVVAGGKVHIPPSGPAVLLTPLLVELRRGGSKRKREPEEEAVGAPAAKAAPEPSEKKEQEVETAKPTQSAASPAPATPAPKPAVPGVATVMTLPLPKDWLTTLDARGKRYFYRRNPDMSVWRHPGLPDLMVVAALMSVLVATPPALTREDVRGMLRHARTLFAGQVRRRRPNGFDGSNSWPRVFPTATVVSDRGALLRTDVERQSPKCSFVYKPDCAAGMLPQGTKVELMGVTNVNGIDRAAVRVGMPNGTMEYGCASLATDKKDLLIIVPSQELPEELPEDDEVWGPGYTGCGLGLFLAPRA